MDEEYLKAVKDAAKPRSKVASREKIIQAANKMFAAQGFEEASLRDIAAEAGLTTGAVFANFADKLDLFQTVFDLEQDRVFALVYAAFDDGLDTLQCLLKKLKIAYDAVQGQQRMFMSAFVLNWTQDRNAEKLFVGSGFRIRELCVFVLKRGVTRGEIPSDADLATASIIMEELFLAILRLAYYGHLSPEAVAAFAEPQLTIIIKGLKFKS